MAVKTFTTGEVLTAADTNTYLNNGGLVYVTSTTIGTTVASVTVSNCFSSTYDNYRIIYANGSASGVDILIQMTLGAVATNYRYAQQTSAYTTGSVLTYAVSGTGGVAYWNIGYTGTNNDAFSTIEVIAPNKATDKAVTATGGRRNALIMMTGVLLDTTQTTSFTFTPASGTLTGGTITVYGYRKA